MQGQGPSGSSAGLLRFDTSLWIWSISISCNRLPSSVRKLICSRNVLEVMGNASPFLNMINCWHKLEKEQKQLFCVCSGFVVPACLTSNPFLHCVARLLRCLGSVDDVCSCTSEQFTVLMYLHHLYRNAPSLKVREEMLVVVYSTCVYFHHLYRNASLLKVKEEVFVCPWIG